MHPTDAGRPLYVQPDAGETPLASLGTYMGHHDRTQRISQHTFLLTIRERERVPLDKSLYT